MREIILAGALLLTAASPTYADAPTTVRVGDAAVDGGYIQPFRNSWRLMGRGSDGAVIQMGVWTDDLRIQTINGRDVIVRRQQWTHEQGAEGYFNVLDHRTMAPVLSQYTNAGGLYRRLEFSADGRTVHYQLSPQPTDQGLNRAAPMTQGDITTEAPFFDFNTGTFGLMIAGFPLREGYSARFPVFRSYDPKAEPAWIDFQVTGRETVPAGAGRTLETWRVIVHSPDTEETMRFNIARQPPYIIRLQQEWNGRDWTFEMM